MLLHFSNRQTLPSHLLLGSEGFIPLIPIPQLQQTVVTKETMTIIILLMINDTINTEWQQRTFGYTLDWATHKVQHYTLGTSQQPMKIHHSLVRVGPDTLLTHFTVFQELVITSIWLKIILLQLKILTFLTFCCTCAIFWGLPTCWCHSLALSIHKWWLTTPTHDLYLKYCHI